MYDKAIKAIHEVHTDMTKTLEQTLENLGGLRDEIQILMEVVEMDIENQINNGGKG